MVQGEIGGLHVGISLEGVVHSGLTLEAHLSTNYETVTNNQTVVIFAASHRVVTICV